MTWSPSRRYSAVAVFSPDLERVVLIHKLRPAWRAGKANFPGGKVEEQDRLMLSELPDRTLSGDELYALVHRRCAVREIAEETGLVVGTADLKLFCTLRFKTPEGEDAECQFFAVVGDVDTARTKESEIVFVETTEMVLTGSVTRRDLREIRTMADIYQPVRTMSNLPWLTAMARQVLKGDGTGWPFLVCEQ